MIAILIKLTKRFSRLDLFAEKFVIAYLMKKKGNAIASEAQKKLLEERSRLELARIISLEKKGDTSASRLELVK